MSNQPAAAVCQQTDVVVSLGRHLDTGGQSLGPTLHEAWLDADVGSPDSPEANPRKVEDLAVPDSAPKGWGFCE